MAENTGNEFRPRPGATLDQWTDAEWGEFTDSLTWENFQLAEIPDGQPYARVTLPQRLDHAAQVLVETERQQQGIFGGLYDAIVEDSTDLDNSIREFSAKHDLPEEEEIAIRQSPEIQEVFAGKGNEEDIEEAKQDLAQWGNSLLRTSFSALLDAGLRQSHMHALLTQLREHNMLLPDSERSKAAARSEQYKQLSSLINGDKEAGQGPRFVVLSSSGKPIFGTSPEISHLEEK